MVRGEQVIERLGNMARRSLEVRAQIRRGSNLSPRTGVHIAHDSLSTRLALWPHFSLLEHARTRRIRTLVVPGRQGIPVVSQPRKKSLELGLWGYGWQSTGGRVPGSYTACGASRARDQPWHRRPPRAPGRSCVRAHREQQPMPRSEHQPRCAGAPRPAREAPI